MNSRFSTFLSKTDHTLLAIVCISFVSLLFRIINLGSRVAHWDEGRVGYDILRYVDTGIWQYRPIVHGPFLPQINYYIFDFAGANDFTARISVAIIGGLLPLAVWLYRDHLNNRELIALSLFLALDPLLLYYSRFMRNDVIVAAFIFIFVGYCLRFLSTHKSQYLYYASAFLALAFTAKENALVYVLILFACIFLLFDHKLFLIRDKKPGWTVTITQTISQLSESIWYWRKHLFIATFEFIFILFLFYAPRTGPLGGIGIDHIFSNPLILPSVLSVALLDSASNLVAEWILGPSTDHAYLPFMKNYLLSLLNASGALVLLSFIGFLSDRYGGKHPRNIVALGFYWGILSLFIYPLSLDISSSWAVVHTIVPFTIPAAVGAAIIYDWASESFSSNDKIGASLAIILLLLISLGTVGISISTSHINSYDESNFIVQYAQPDANMQDTLQAIHLASVSHSDLDVLYYGDYFLVENEEDAYLLPLRDGEWYNRLPIPWYLESYGSTIDSTADILLFEAILEDQNPPVIIARSNEVEEIQPFLSEYRQIEHEIRQFNVDIVFFIHQDYATSEN